LSCLYGYLVGNGLFHRKGSHPVVYESGLLNIENDQKEVIVAVYSPDDKRIQELIEYLEDRNIVGIIIMKVPMSRSVINDFKRIMLLLGIFQDQTQVYTFQNIISCLSSYSEIGAFITLPSGFSTWYPCFIDPENVDYLYQEFVKACLSSNGSTYEDCRSLCSDLFNSMGKNFDFSDNIVFNKYHLIFASISNNDYIKTKKIIHKIFRIAYKSSMNHPSVYMSRFLNSTLLHTLTEYIQKHIIPKPLF